MSETSGPWSAYDEKTVGLRTQKLYAFLEELWDENRPGGPLRDMLRGYSDTELRAYLAQNLSIVVPTDVQILLTDIESGYMAPRDPKIPRFYVLVIPPKLRRQTHDPSRADFMEAQAALTAWFHATVDGYGM